ncbi:hypothetical protein BCON_0188g00070 [Botryotinia convoluta]|uniref:Uncharacterized protein n=1 Tax=Botryotinia convoluta TaxID=54673 RepID=A0A4Z1I035_9HELO|nr:hypothetical protein BCON_0188g00070 [Botryotinia convoluta]
MPVNLQPSAGTSGSFRKEKSRGEATRRMPTNSRPPLSHRIRASFEGKKSQDSTSSKHASFSGASPTDLELLRRIIDEAISGDVFQAGLASHIAKLLKPEIKTALDTIEPVVNAVLQHELLLKRTNNSVDHVLLKLESMADEEGATTPGQARLSIHGALTSHPVADEGPLPIPDNSASGTGAPASTSNQESRPLFNRGLTYTAGKLTEISDSLDLNNHKLGKVVEGIAELNNLLTSNERLDSLKESSDKNDTKTSVIQTQIDQLQENVRVVITRIGPDLGINVKAINDHLTGETPIQETRAVASNGSGGDVELLQAISSQLEALKDSLETGTSSHNDNLGLLKEKINALQSTLDVQKDILGEIKAADNTTEILAGIHKSNESHEAHATVLGELKERNTQPVDLSTQPAPTSADAETLQTILTEIQKSNEAHEKHTAALGSIKESDASAAILAEVQKSNDSHVSHASALESLKSITSPPEQTTAIDLGLFETKMDSLTETSTAILTEVQKSNESHVSHVSHAAALENIKALPNPPSESPTASASVDLGGLEKDIEVVIEKLDMHAAILEEIKTKDGSGLGGIDVSAFDSHFGSITTSLEAHTATLDEIKSRDLAPADFSPIISMLETHTATLEVIKSRDSTPADNGPIISMLEAHAAMLEEIKSKDTGSNPDLSPITTLLEAHITALEDIKAKDTANSVDLSPITSTLDSHRAVLDEIVSKGVQSSGAPAAINMDVFDTHFGSITGILAAHTAALDEIKSKDGPSNASTPAENTIEILDKHFGSITNVLETHTAALEEIKAKDFTPTTGQTELNTAAFDDHFSSLTRMLDSHTEALDEIKSKNNYSAPLSTSRDNVGLDSFEPHVTAIKSVLDAHMGVLQEIKSEALAKNDMDAMVVDNLLEPHIIAIKSTLSAHTEILDDLKSNVHTNTTDSSEIANDSLPKILNTLNRHTNLLTEIKNADVSDEILTALHELQEGNSAAFNTLKESDVSDEILTALHTCNDSQEKLDRSLLELQTAVNISLSSEQNRNKSIDSVEAVQAPIAAVDLSGLETQINAVIATLEGQNVVLGEIKDTTHAGMEAHGLHTTTLGEIKDAASASNDSHATHAALLGEIRDAANASNESHGTHTSTLGVIRDAAASLSTAHATQIATLVELKHAINASNESHNTHTSTLAEIRDAAASSNDAILTHTATLSGLKEAINASNDSHTSHAAALEDLKSIHSTQSSPDATSEPTSPPVLDTSALDTQLTTIITSLESQTSTLGEMKDAHASHITTLSEIKEATTVSNESHTSHTTVLCEIKEAIAPIHGINEAISIHTGLLEGLKEDTGSQHNEVKSNIDGLRKLVDESSIKHEESLSKHGDLIKGHGDLVKENHDGLKGTIAGLALGGIAGVEVMKAMDEVEEKNGKVSDVVERDMEVPEAPAEEDKVIEEEPPALEPEIVVVEDSAPESTEQNPEPPVEEQVVSEPEVPTEDERTASEETLVEPELEPEAIVTDTEKTVDINEDPDPTPVDQEPEPEAVEKEVPTEEPTSIEAEAETQEAVVEEPILTEEEPEPATMETTEDTAAIESQQTGKDLSGEETLPQEESEPFEPNRETELPASNNNEEPEVLEKEEETEGTIPSSIEQSGLAQDTPEEEASQVIEIEEPIPEEGDVTELSKDELDFEGGLVVEEIPGEEETVVVEGQVYFRMIRVISDDCRPEESEEEAFGESERAEIQQNEDVGDDDSKSIEETAPVAVEEEKPTEDIVLDNVVEDLSPSEEVLQVGEDKPVDEPILQEPDENLTTNLQQTLPAEEEEKLPEIKESNEPSLEEMPTENTIPEVLIDTPPAHSEETSPLEANEPVPESEQTNVPGSADPPVESEETPIVPGYDVETQTQVPAASDEVPADNSEFPTDSEVIEPSKEEKMAYEETEMEKLAEGHPVDSKEINLERECLEPKNEDLPTEDAKVVVEPSKEDKSSESAAEIETPLLDSNDMNEVPAEIDAKVLKTEVIEPNNEETPDHAEENVKPSHDQSNTDAPIETEVPVSDMNDRNEKPVEIEAKDLEMKDPEPHNKEIPEQSVENSSQTVQEESDSEPVVETEKSVPDSNSHDQHTAESEEKSVELPFTENVIEEISSEPTEVNEPLQEEIIAQLPVEIEKYTSDLNNQDEPPVEHEELSEELENLKASTPSIDNGEKTLEPDSHKSSSEHAPLEIEETPIEVSQEQSPDSTIETEIPAIESNDQTQIPVESEEKSVEPAVSGPEAAGMDSEEPQAGDGAQMAEISPQEIVEEPEVEDQSPVEPKSRYEAQEVTDDYEPEEQHAVEVPIEGSVTESPAHFPTEEESVEDSAPVESNLEPEVVNENVSDEFGSSEEGQIVANDGDEPLSTEREILDSHHEESVPGNEPTSESVIHEDSEDIRDAEKPTEIDAAETPGQDSILESKPKSEPVVYEDPEDAKAREEIAALNAEMARILAEAEEEERRNTPVETETIHEDEPREPEVEYHVEEPIHVSEAQLLVESHEIPEDPIENEQAQAEVTEPEEQKTVSVTNEDHSNDTSLKEPLESHVVSSTDSEEDVMPIEPEIHEVESTNILPADESHQIEDIIPSTHEDIAESQSRIVEDERVEEKYLVLSSEDERTDIEIPSIAEQSENEVMESIPVEVSIEPETEETGSAHLSGHVSLPVDRVEDKSLPIQLESESDLGEVIPEEPRLEGEINPEQSFMESEQGNPKDEMTLEDYPAEETSTSKLDSINESTQDAQSEGEEIENESPSVEHLEVSRTETNPEEYLKDGNFRVDEDAHSVEHEVAQEDLDDHKELGTDLVVPESLQFEAADDNEWDEVYDASDDKVQGLKPSAEFQSTMSNHAEAPAIEENQHDSEPSQDEIASEIPLPSPSVQEKQAILEEDYPAVQHFPAQHDVEPESYQTFDNVFPIENRAVKNSSHVSNEDELEFADEPDFREVPIVADREQISENNFATGVKDDSQLEDTESIYSQENEPAITTEHERQERDDPRATASQYVSFGQLQPEQESEPSHVIAEIDSTHEAQFRQPETSAEQRYIGYGYDYEEPALNTQTYPDSEDDMESFQPGPATSRYESRGSYPFQGTSFSRSIPQPRYSSHEEVPRDTRTSFNDQDNNQHLRPMPTYSSSSYSQEHLSESYPTQEIHYNEPEPQQDQPITPTYQSSHQDTIPATLPTTLTTKISTETFPTYDESRPVSQGMNFGLPIRGAERVETIRESPEPTYPSYNEPMRSPAQSRLPIASQRSSDSMRRSHSPELRKQSSYYRYGHDEPVRSLGASQGSRFGLQGTHPARESHEEVPEHGNEKRSSNVKNILSRFEGGESSSSTPSQQESFNIPTYQDRFGTSLPRPAGNRSIRKQPQYEQESHFEAVTPLDHDRFDVLSEESSLVQTSLEERELQLESGESSAVQTPLEGEFRLDEGTGENVNAGVPKKRRSKRGKKKGNGGGGGGQA